MIVPSCEINPKAIHMLDGTRTLMRLKKALEIYNSSQRYKKPNYIVVTGGAVNAKRKGYTTPHALLMKDWLINNGVPQEIILVDDLSLDSYQNINNSLNLLKNKLTFSEFRDAIYYLVTEKNHSKRMILSLYYQEVDPRDVTVFPVEYEPEKKLSLSEQITEKCCYMMHRIDPIGKNPLAQLNRWLRR